MSEQDREALFLGVHGDEDDAEAWLDGLDDDDDDDGDDDGQSVAESGQTEGGAEVDAYGILTRYHAAQSPHDRDVFYAGLSDAERSALNREGESGPFRWDEQTFTPPTPDKPIFEPEHLRRAEQEARAGADAIAKGRLIVDEATFETALDLRQELDSLAGEPRVDSLLRLEDLVNRARVHAASAGEFDESNIVARRDWMDSGRRHHSEQTDHRGRKREVVLTRAETDTVIAAQREARAERRHLRVASDASPDLVEALKALEAGSGLSLDDYLGLSKMDRIAVQRKMTPGQRDVLRRTAEYRAEEA